MHPSWQYWDISETFCKSKDKKKSKLPKNPPSALILLLSTLANNLCLLSSSISVQTHKKTSCGHCLDDGGVEIGIFLKFSLSLGSSESVTASLELPIC